MNILELVKNINVNDLETVKSVTEDSILQIKKQRIAQEVRNICYSNNFPIPTKIVFHFSKSQEYISLTRVQTFNVGSEKQLQTAHYLYTYFQKHYHPEELFQFEEIIIP